MDKKQQASSSSQGNLRFKVGPGEYDAAAWRRDNYGKGGGPVMHTDWSKFDKCDNPSARIHNAKVDSAQVSNKKK